MTGHAAVGYVRLTEADYSHLSARFIPLLPQQSCQFYLLLFIKMQIFPVIVTFSVVELPQNISSCPYLRYSTYKQSFSHKTLFFPSWGGGPYHVTEKPQDPTLKYFKCTT